MGFQEICSLSAIKEYKVLCRCFTYNQASYILDALNGFAMQQTDFPFACLIMDDASTDGEQEIIKSWMNENCDMSKSKEIDIPTSIVVLVPHKTNINCSFAFYYLKKNLNQQKDLKMAHVTPWRDCSTYEAMCEGDDCWIDPHKLQKQIDWLEKHPDYSMCCSDSVVQTPERDLDWSRYETDTDICVPEMVLGGGAYIPTCSLVYKRCVTNNYPAFCNRCHVGDYPLQIWCATHGKVRYFAGKQVVYRYGSIGSWTNSQNVRPLKSLVPGWRTELDMLDGFNELTCRKYEYAFKLAFFRNLYIQTYRYGIDNREIFNEFKEIESYPFETLFDDFFRWCFDESCDTIQKKFRKRILTDVLLFYYELGVIYPGKFLLSIRKINHKLLASHKETYSEIITKDFFVMKKYSLQQVLSGYAAFCETKFGVCFNNLRVKIGIRSLFKK